MQPSNYHTCNEIKSQTEAVDGASLIQIFWMIYLPLGKPALAARVNAICPEYHTDDGPGFLPEADDAWWQIHGVDVWSVE